MAELRARTMPVIAQDPGVRVGGRILTTPVSVPWEDLEPGPIGHRVCVVDYDATTGTMYKPATVEDDLDLEDLDDDALLGDPSFHARNVYALVMRTLARFEYALGRRVGWGFSAHQLKVVPHAFEETEEPGLDPEAQAPAGADGKGARGARAAVSRLSAMQALAAAALAEVPRLKGSSSVPNTVAEQIRFLGETNLKNADSVRNLAEMGKRHVYASFGTKLPLSRVLPGVGVDVLGPPTLEQAPAIASQATTDKEEFWHLAARGLSEGGEGAVLFPGAPVARRIPQEARWVIPRVDRMRGEELLAIVRSLDGVLNNTSAILLFEIGESLLVFPGDAQLENWHYALRECDDAEAICERLAKARFYKVGHHGSLNATPKSLWNRFEHRDPKPEPGRLATMVSTASGKHGSPARGTEVPRRVLIEELERMSDLSNTQSLKARDVFWNDVELEL